MTEGAKTKVNLQVALAGEADANRRYTAYGIRALQEGHLPLRNSSLKPQGLSPSMPIHTWWRWTPLGQPRRTCARQREERRVKSSKCIHG